MTQFQSPKVEDAFAAFPPSAQDGLLRLRDLIFDTAAQLPEPATLSEELKWGQPAYLTRKGTTIRLGVPKQAQFGLFVHCQTRLISEFSQTFPGTDRIEGTRAVLFDEVGEISPERHGWLIARALTYHV
ncbi:DUF1801 domain-containing protein [Ruegeria sp. 2205SS24-7]|uniref:DUF1801 domain-containing protein n=1 Tax=Ruegeria discodermiae TaxID=3064389 RepID=UPI00274132A1|nr:DUF1801 domain-containing protein [Ruegeria sp. 2205SS24-7]MDP5218307.1 DUF1801 domain-containing protein [Ruegeria sp. 2205SS24-7]